MKGKHVLVKTGMGNPYDRGRTYILGKISLTARYKKSEARAVCDGDSGHSLKPLALKSSALLIGVLNLFRAKGHNCKGLDERGRLKTFWLSPSKLTNNLSLDMHIHKELKTAIYNPSPVLRVYIPKGKHDKRPLGIPIVKDRVVQQAFRQIIEPIFEKDFSDNSFGFRLKRCCHDAIKRLQSNQISQNIHKKSKNMEKKVLYGIGGIYRLFTPTYKWSLSVTDTP